MKAYGKSRRDCANRHIRGTSRPCPCCIPSSAWRKVETMKKAARRAAKQEVRAHQD